MLEDLTLPGPVGVLCTLVSGPHWEGEAVSITESGAGSFPLWVGTGEGSFLPLQGSWEIGMAGLGILHLMLVLQACNTHQL